MVPDRAPPRFTLPAGIRWLEHTADAGFAVRGASAQEVYQRCVAALRHLLLGDQPVADGLRLELELQGQDRAERLVALLEEVLLRLEVERFVTARAEVGEDEPGQGTLYVALLGEHFDPARHRQVREVKAITYHGLGFARRPDGSLEATVVVDL
ncbi:MAG: archease [Deltaproteobacteria bacterium]|nr:archease [Deltaproteobacteria bacterium]